MNKLLIFSTLPFLLFSCHNQQQLPLLYHETFSAGSAEKWQPNFPDNWQIKEMEGKYSYELSKIGEHGEIRKPTSISILTPYVVGDFVLEVRAKCYTDTSTIHRDICLFYGYQDSLHFYFTHYSATSDNVHNIIGIVNNADRTKINNEPISGSIARLTSFDWYKLKVKRNIQSGTIECFIDNMDNPILTAIDTTFTFGKVGIGSFDDTGAFSEIKLWGNIEQK